MMLALCMNSIGLHPHDIFAYRTHQGYDKTLHIVQEIQSFADKFVSVLEKSLLDFGLAGRVEVVSVGGARVNVLDDGKDVDHVLLVEGEQVLHVQDVLAKLKLN